jgi:hypothetical protein
MIIPLLLLVSVLLMFAWLIISLNSKDGAREELNGFPENYYPANHLRNYQPLSNHN